MRIALSLTVSLFCLLAAGCGQKGPLFLPTEPAGQSAPAKPTPVETPPAAEPQTQSQPSQS